MGSHRRKPATGFRPDIEGLRAVAVLLVIIDHLGWGSGGFVGVDIFFVISGFLITGLLVREVERTGRISFVDFYRRRARRILPAALAVLVVTCVAARVVFLATRAHQTVVDSGWALVFLANVHFAASGTDYFQAALPPSLVQHFWSLSVEEQFYVVWPVVLLATVWLLRRRDVGPARTRRLLRTVLGALTLVSLVWSVYQSATDPTAAYFQTPARAWELGVGALLAVSAPQLKRITDLGRAVLALLGLTAIALAVVVINPGSAFPAPWGLLPVLGVSAVLVSGMGDGVTYSVLVLTNPVSRYIGRISYSLYLWHWPTIMVIESLLPRSSGVFYPLLFCVMAGASIGSYHLIETPFRTGTVWTQLRRLRAEPVPALRRSVAGRARPGPATVVVLALVAASLGFWHFRPAPAPVPVAALRSPFHSAAADHTVATPSASLTSSIQQAVQATAFPPLNPPLGSVGYGSKVPEWQCITVSQVNVGSCSYPGSASTGTQHHAVLLGDSVAISYMSGIRGALGPKGWTVQSLTMGECPAFPIPVDNEVDQAGFTQLCAAHQTWVMQQLAAARPDLIIMVTASNTLKRLASKNVGAAAGAEWQRDMTAALHTLSGLAGRIVVLAPPPEGKPLQACATATSTPAACLQKPAPEWFVQENAEEQAAAAAKVTYVDTHLWFCSDQGICPSFVGNAPVRWDGTHLTAVYSASLAGPLAGVLDG